MPGHVGPHPLRDSGFPLKSNICAGAGHHGAAKPITASPHRRQHVENKEALAAPWRAIDGRQAGFGQDATHPPAHRRQGGQVIRREQAEAGRGLFLALLGFRRRIARVQVGGDIVYLPGAAGGDALGGLIQ